MTPHLNNEVHDEDVHHSIYHLGGNKKSTPLGMLALLVLGLMTLVATVASRMSGRGSPVLPVATMSGRGNPFLPVTFRGTSHVTGCREFYNSTTGEIDRVRLTSKGSAYWAAIVPRRQGFVVVSLKTCAVRLTGSGGLDFAVTSDVNRKKVEVEVEPENDCNSPDHFHEVHFGLEVPKGWWSHDIRFQVEHVGSYRSSEKYEIYFRDFAVRVYQL
jgi:hypothetical protein